MTLAGCSTTPDIEYDELPHFMYSPLSETGIIDRRAEFAQIFCDVLRSGIEPEYADQSCIDFLHIDQLPASPTVPSQIDTGRPMRVVFVPGFLGDCLQSHTTPFQNSRKLRHMDPRNNGQLIYRDAIVPDSDLLAYVRADHLEHH